MRTLQNQITADRTALDNLTARLADMRVDTDPINLDWHHDKMSDLLDEFAYREELWLDRCQELERKDVELQMAIDILEQRDDC